MLSSFRFFIFSVLVFTVGGSFWLFRSYQGKMSMAKSSEQYWTETGLDSSALKSLLRPQACNSSEKSFLACANAILTVASRYNLSLNLQGDLVSTTEMSFVERGTEKKQLESWRNFFRSDLENAKKISFLSAWEQLESRYMAKNQKAMMIGMGMNGIISVVHDPHTYLMPVSQFEEVISRADSRKVTLGIKLGNNKKNFVIRKVIEGSPAKKAGLKRGDVLLSINKQSLKGLMRARVLELLKGDIGEIVSLQVSREGKKLSLRMRRKEITVATVSTRVIEGIKPVGVVALNTFAQGACEKVKDSLDILKKAHVRGLLLDLRDNPGGQVEEAACIASLFVGPEKKIFEIRYLDSAKQAEQYVGSQEQRFYLPMAVLVNGSSASASEIVAGALRDLNRAILVGERTFGKGSFQEGEIWQFNKKIAIFKTQGFYYLPSGRSPQLTGLIPDVAVNFEEISVLREADLFFSPLQAPVLQVAPEGNHLALQDCLDMDDGAVLEDLQVSKAKQILFCANTLARAGL